MHIPQALTQAVMTISAAINNSVSKFSFRHAAGPHQRHAADTAVPKPKKLERLLHLFKRDNRASRTPGSASQMAVTHANAPTPTGAGTLQSFGKIHTALPTKIPATAISVLSDLSSGAVTSSAVVHLPEASSENSVQPTLGLRLKGIIRQDIKLTDAAANDHHLGKIKQAQNNVAYIELLSFDSPFKKWGYSLYEHSFKIPAERVPLEDIDARMLNREQNKLPNDISAYTLAYVDKHGYVNAYSQGGTLETKNGYTHYMEYCCVADRAFMKKEYDQDINYQNRGILSLIYATDNAVLLSAQKDAPAKNVHGTIWEANPKGLDDNWKGIFYSLDRLKMYGGDTGGRLVMGRMSNGKLVSLHIQPQLSDDTKPIALHFMFRPAKFESHEARKEGAMPMDNKETIEMLMAFPDFFRQQGLKEEYVINAENIIKERLASLDLDNPDPNKRGKIVLLPQEDLPTVIELARQGDALMEEQILELYDVDTLDDAQKVFDASIDLSKAIAVAKSGDKKMEQLILKIYEAESLDNAQRIRDEHLAAKQAVAA